MSPSAAGNASIPKVGDVAPDFTLPSTAGEPIKLSSLRGRPVLLAFFPLAFSGTCTAELCDIRDDYSAFTKRGVTVLPISVDSTYSLVAYKQHHEFPVEMASDFHRDVSRLYGVLHAERFFSNRAYFLIDEKGVIRWEHVEENPSHKRTNAELLEAIDRLG